MCVCTCSLKVHFGHKIQCGRGFYGRSTSHLGRSVKRSISINCYKILKLEYPRFVKSLVKVCDTRNVTDIRSTRISSRLRHRSGVVTGGKSGDLGLTFRESRPSSG